MKITQIKFNCDYRGNEKTTNECYECSRHTKCELFLDMTAEEEDRDATERLESKTLSLLTSITS